VALGGFDRLAQDHHRGHRPDAAGYRRHGGHHVGDGRIDVAPDDAVPCRVDSAVDDDRRRIEHVARDEPGDASRGHQQLRASRLHREVRRCPVADDDRGVARQQQ